MQGCRGSCSGWTDYRNIKPANARGSPCTIVASSPCRGLVLLSRSVLLAERSSCCGEDREKETHTHTAAARLTSPPPSPTPPTTTSPKKEHQGLKKRRNLWSFGRKENTGKVGSENPRQDEPSVEGLNSKVDTVGRWVGFWSLSSDATVLGLP